MSGFSIDWLDLRERADHRARSPDLRGRALRWLQEGGSPSCTATVVDLGAGTGSTLRALELPDGMSVTWRLVDHDQALLAEAERRHGGGARVETFVRDLSRMDSLPLDDARLITASALFDLVSGDLVSALAGRLQAQCRQAAVGIYAALNYDGVTRWTPVHPLDEPVLRAFNQDQRRDKGLGPALGPQAGEALQRTFVQAGFQVYLADSPWLLDDSDSDMLSALVDGIATAVAGSPGIEAVLLEEWAAFRRAHIPSGTCVVGHTDVLALPL